MNDTSPKQTVTIKKYANRRLYNTATSSYVTLENLAVMVKEGTEFNVYDAKTGEELTRAVLTQIIVEEEGKSGQNLLPVSFLRQLIGFYGDSMQWMVPKYLEQSMQTLTTNQDQLRGYFQNALGNVFPFGTTLEEMSKQNLSMFEHAMSLFSPFSALTTPKPNTSGTPSSTNTTTNNSAQAPAAAATAPAASAPEAPAPTQIADFRSSTQPVSDSTEEMQQKISNLQKQLAELAKKRG